MGCKIAENFPLKELRNDLGLGLQCHSHREDCVHNLYQPSGEGTFGIPGAIIGYCQALYHKEMDHENHTRFIFNELKKIKAPWFKSHELYWGNKGNITTQEFISNSMKPLLGEGRIPILITPLNPSKDYEVINDILKTEAKIFNGETALVRIVVDGRDSIEKSVKLMKIILRKAIDKKEMPKFWPLLQGGLSSKDWNYMKILMGEDWKYCNIAVNPFTFDQLPMFCKDNITVAQVVVGHKEGIHDSGRIALPEGMRISGAKNCDDYNINEYFEKLTYLKVPPTLIVLGPTLPSWSNKYNSERLLKLLPHLKMNCNVLWNSLSNDRRDFVWSLPA